MSISKIEESFALHVRALKLPVPEREHKFHPWRKWRFDFAWVGLKIAVELEGGVWSGGRHTRGKGFTNDCEKINVATAMGWKVFRFTGDMVNDGRAAEFIRVQFEH